MKISKLFAKHLKILDQVSSIKLGKCAIGVGTPNRIVKINEEMGDAGLKNINVDFHSHLKVIVIDASYVDMKKHTVISLDACKADIFAIMEKAFAIKQNKMNSHIKILIF